jgi:hypothetical protein
LLNNTPACVVSTPELFWEGSGLFTGRSAWVKRIRRDRQYRKRMDFLIARIIN